MADDDSTETLELEPVVNDEEGGGPVKTFLEHLEDLRWTLIRCALAIFIGMIACLSGSNYVIKFLTWPLERAERFRTSSEPRVSFILGTNVLAHMSSSAFGLPGLSTNQDTVFRLVPRIDPANPTNILLALAIDPSPPKDIAKEFSLKISTLGPIEAFSIVMQIAIFGGLTVSAPPVLFFLAQFILPALHRHERKFIFKVAGWSTFLFLAGVAFCYLVMLVICIGTTVSFTKWLGFGADMWRASEYISFVCWFLVGMGVAFQLPLVILTAVKLGFLDVAKLSKFRAYWVIVGLIIAGFITPDGNPFNMLLLFLPLEILYEISVVIAWFWERAERKKAKLEGTA